MVDLKKLRQLVKLMRDNDLRELDLEDKEGEKIHLRRGGDEQTPMYVAAPQPLMHNNPAAAAGSSASHSATGGLGGLVEVQSPMVGTYYSAPSPDAENFVAVGTRVNEETVVCIIEAMKVFNEIKAEIRGTIEKVLVENGQAVEFGQPLFLVKP